MEKLRKLIREMIMSEMREHTDDEIVTFNEIDLYHEYDKLNDLLFGGELPKVPLSWNNTKGKHGMVKTRIELPSRRPTRIIGLYMTKYFKINYRKFKDILAHEMIHVKNVSDAMKTNSPRYKGDAHGYDFIREMNRINSMGLGFNVTDKEYESHDVSDHIKGRNIYVGVLTIKGAKNGEFIIAMTPVAYAQREKLEGIFNYNVRNGRYRSAEIEYYSTDNPYFLKFSVQRNFNSGVSYKAAKEEDIQKLKEVGEEVGDFIAGGSPKSVSNPTVFEPKKLEARRLEPTPIQRKPEPIKPEISDEMKEVNRRIMSIFKSISDKSVQEKLFDILKTSDPIRKQIKIDNYNQALGPKYGYI